MAMNIKNDKNIGFDNPLKTEEKAEYGYEVWVTLNGDEKEDANEHVDMFPQTIKCRKQ